MPAQKKTGLPKWAQEEFARLDNTINRQCREHQGLLQENKELKSKIELLNSMLAGRQVIIDGQSEMIDSLCEQIDLMETY